MYTKIPPNFLWKIWWYFGVHLREGVYLTRGVHLNCGGKKVVFWCMSEGVKGQSLLGGSLVYPSDGGVTIWWLFGVYLR